MDSQTVQQSQSLSDKPNAAEQIKQPDFIDLTGAPEQIISAPLRTGVQGKVGDKQRLGVKASSKSIKSSISPSTPTNSKWSFPIVFSSMLIFVFIGVCIHNYFSKPTPMGVLEKAEAELKDLAIKTIITLAFGLISFVLSHVWSFKSMKESLEKSIETRIEEKLKKFVKEETE